MNFIFNYDVYLKFFMLLQNSKNSKKSISNIKKLVNSLRITKTMKNIQSKDKFV